MEAKLNERQKKIMMQVHTQGIVTTTWVVNRLKVVRDTARRDFGLLVKLGLLDRKGAGRSIHYIPGRSPGGLPDNQPEN